MDFSYLAELLFPDVKETPGGGEGDKIRTQPDGVRAFRRAFPLNDG